MRPVILKMVSLCLALCAALWLPWNARADRSSDHGGRPAEETADTTSPRYIVRIEGVSDGELRTLMENVSDTVKSRANPPGSPRQLLRRAQDDIDNLLRAAYSYGYFKAAVTPRVEEQNPPMTVVFAAELGPRFTMGDVTLAYPEGRPTQDISTFRDLWLKRGSGFEATAVLDAEKRITRLLGDQGYPVAQVLDRKVVADFKANTVEVRWTVLPGPAAIFGPLALSPTSDTSVDMDYIRSLLPWADGEAYSRKDEEDGRQALIDTGLFSVVEFAPHKVEDLEAQNRVPMHLTLRDTRPRTFRFGGSYATDLGPGVEGSWRHRNLLGGGELFTAQLDVNAIYKSFETTFRQPQFMADRQTLRIVGKVIDDRPEGFTSQSAEVAAVLERKLGRYYLFGGGVGVKALSVEDDPLMDDKTFGLGYIPLFASRDTRNDILDPIQGSTLRIDAAPYYDFFNNTSFFVYNVTGATYMELIDRRRLVLALRARFGEILGAELSELPAPERFYAGGGGSVRGYAYKTLSDLRGKDPEGGKSIIEASAELRLRFTRSWGMVAFMDGGRAYRDSMPDMSQRFFLGAGAGLRYYTDFGPIRIDVAFPFNRREEFDSRFQAYASIGQSF